MEFVKTLMLDLSEQMTIHIENNKKARSHYFNANYMNRNHGKYALKRKIIMLRQELLNLEKMLDK